MKILLTGSTGQLGKAIITQKPKDITLLLPLRNELDLSNQKDCYRYLEFHKPDLIINSGAFTNVDRAEKEKDLCSSINTQAPLIFAKFLKDQGGKFLQISTDYVFDGANNTPYKANDSRNPLSHYGYSKAKAEEILEKILSPNNQLVILRTSWLLSPSGKNFLFTMLNLHQKKKEINVVSDQIGAMSSSFDVAKVCWEIVDNWDLILRNHYINHWTCLGVLSWYDLAIEIGYLAKKYGIVEIPAKIKPITTAEYPTLAKRPNYSILDCSDTQMVIKNSRTYWRYELEEIILKIMSQK